MSTNSSYFRKLYFRTRKRLIRWLEDNRGLVIVFFCLPASFLFDTCLKIGHWFRRRFLSAPDKHDERVAIIEQKVKSWNALPKSEKIPMCTSRTTWLSLSTKFFSKHLYHQIPINLYDILELDTERQIVKVEPNVTVRDMTQFLVPKGYTLEVTLEIGDATAGGLAFGVGMTTYSHKVGLYQETIESYDVILGDGTFAHVTEDNEYSDLYRCLPWSHGSLAFLVSLELRIIPVKSFVHLKYIPVSGQKKYCDMIRELSGANDKDKMTPDFLEATIFSPEEAVIMIGNFADVKTEDQKAKMNDVTLWYKPWFYKHTEKFLSKGGEEYIPLEAYLLRHNRAIFWVLESMIPFGNNPLFRLFFGWLCPPKPAFLKFTTTSGIRNLTFAKQVFQDIVMPINVLEDQINKATELFDTFPLLVYPCRIYDHGVKHQGQLLKRRKCELHMEIQYTKSVVCIWDFRVIQTMPGNLNVQCSIQTAYPPRPDQMTLDANWAMFNDLGVYGTPGPVKRREKYDCVNAMRSMEKFIRDVGGYSFLYADIFMTESEFEEMFDLTLYEKVRKKYGANEAFPHLYDKVKPEIDVFTIGRELANEY